MRILASDLDGTLVEFDHISEENLNGIKSLKDAGHKFIISTGRTYSAVTGLIDKYNIDYDYLVLCNGGQIINSKNEIVYDEWINKEVSRKIVEEYCENENFLMYVDNSEQTYLINNHKVDPSIIDKILNMFGKRVELIELDKVNEKYKIMAIFSIEKDFEKAEVMKNEIVEKYGDYVQAYRNQFFVDVVPKGCSKGEALLRVLELENISKDNLYVVGDSFNDISMFNITNNSYTFNHAEDGVKGHANGLVDYVHEVIKNILD